MAADLRAELAGLPARYGFENVQAFLKAVRTAGGSRRGRRAATPSAKRGPRRKRATVTDATRAEVKKLVEEGKTGGEIAKAVGVSLPTVQNIKKSLGLVKKRK
ncbi:MAG TPA: helix-turn-helix domain-containing protein [Lacunisphaera sp.]|nr:helix-turn-helix domain-containing protein [Lacunisphaera sp.]